MISTIRSHNSSPKEIIQTQNIIKFTARFSDENNNNRPPLTGYPLSKNCIFIYINTKMSVCFFVFLSVHVFLGHFETDLETLWHKLAFCSWVCSKIIIFSKMLFLKELLPFFYISSRFLCKFGERL